MRVYGREAETPIIILTARVEENEKVLGLELGADDYVTKPFSMRELTARIRAVLRRAGKTSPQAELLRAGDITLDRNGRLVKIGDKYVDLTPSEFDLLAALMATPGRAFSRLELLDLLQGNAFEGYERTIDVHIRNLRTKIEKDPRHPHYVETVYGIGYRFAVDL
jgi:DNA-binding response OmpR family regulator